MEKPKEFDLWTWPKCELKIRSLAGRLGFPKGDTLYFLDYEITLSEGTVTDTTLNQPLDPVPIDIFFLLYRYAEASEVPLDGKLITYRQVSGGRAYDPVYQSRAVNPIAQTFGLTPDLLSQAAENLAGIKAHYGDLAYTIPALPFVPLTYILWLPDDEFPARSQILLDATARTYLDAEALAHLASLTTKRLRVIAKQNST